VEEIGARIQELGEVRSIAPIFRVVASAKRTISAATRDALRSRSRRRPRPRFLAGASRLECLARLLLDSGS
jgi:hypothetical protein